MNDGFFKFVGICAGERFNFFAILQENECWHARDIVFHSQFLAFVYIHLKWPLWEHTHTRKHNMNIWLISFIFSNRKGKGIMMKGVSFYLDHNNVCSILLSQFFQNWSNHFAWSAPSGKKVDNNNFLTSILHLLIEISLK